MLLIIILRLTVKRKIQYKKTLKLSVVEKQKIYCKLADNRIVNIRDLAIVLVGNKNNYKWM